MHRIRLNVTEWVSYEDMTDEEKSQNLDCAITNGYLRKKNYRDAWQEFWETLDEHSKNLIKTLPNFDPGVFHEITGVDFH